MKGSEIVILRKKECDFCDEVESVLDSLGKGYSEVKVCENRIGKAISDRKCGSRSCLIIDGKPVDKPDRSKLAQRLLD